MDFGGGTDLNWLRLERLETCSKSVTQALQEMEAGISSLHHSH